MGALSTCCGHGWDALFTAGARLQVVRGKGDGEGAFLTGSQLGAVRCQASHHPSPGTCTPLSTQREQLKHQKLCLPLDAVTAFHGNKAVGQVL